MSLDRATKLMDIDLLHVLLEAAKTRRKRLFPQFNWNTEHRVTIAASLTNLRRRLSTVASPKRAEVDFSGSISWLGLAGHFF
jgi:hypothetical protein